MKLARVYVTAVLEGPIDQTWQILRDFNGLPDYHPLFATSHIEDGKPADQIGCVRNFKDHHGGHLREQLLALSDRDYLCSYQILEAHLPVRNYVSQMKLWPVTESNRTFGEWWAEFEVDDADREDTIEKVTDTFRLAFQSVSDRFAT
ncbi:MxaD family protein [Rhodovibrio sodomensis]|uniref:MxaD family protein n=1 Tax=Rhodovibrio sodomensis TaxID=1088 RepID=A0ABS1DH29_9PROT|nr:SRPBCC family protein [Rhodovibrio sodomensis]MBK1668823.1 MxaD family protein [Rhodovibrio sodomensis]